MLYGEDFIEKSIRSVIDAVDTVYVFWTNKVWGGCTEVEYKGETIKFPEKFDDAVEIIKNIGSPKIKLIEHYHPTPRGQFTELVNNHVTEGIVLLIEPDQVMDDAKGAFDYFETLDFRCACLPQIEYWKSEEYAIPQRNRPGPIFWTRPLEDTAPNGLPLSHNVPFLPFGAHNYGFCVSDKTMYWKHLTAMAFSPVIGDSRPRPDWYEEVWLKWTPEMRDLEISLGHEKAIPYAIKIG